MGQVLGYAGDFRSSAEAVSTKALKAGRVAETGDLSKVGFSLCIRTPFDAEQNRRKLKVLAIANLVVVVMLFFGGVGLSTLGSLKLPQFKGILVVASGLMVVAAGTLASYAVELEHWFVRRRLRALNASDASFTPTTPPVMLRMEDPQTANQLKIIVDDIGYLYCDAARQLIVIEAIVDRYVIHGRDVRDCYIQSTRTARFCVITYRVARSETFLTVALNYTSRQIIKERQQSDNKMYQPLVAILEQTLGIAVAPAPITA